MQEQIMQYLKEHKKDGWIPIKILEAQEWSNSNLCNKLIVLCNCGMIEVMAKGGKRWVRKARKKR